MAKVITFSRTFPSYHPKAGEPTYFVEKLWASLGDSYFDQLADEERQFNPRLSLDSFDPKHHTIRAGHRWKVGDWFSPRVWSGKPYNTKQIIIAPDIQIKKIWDFSIHAGRYFIDDKPATNWNANYHSDLALNDGLTVEDMQAWFKFPKPFEGQIICWNESIEY